jgi:hypothetical protein
MIDLKLIEALKAKLAERVTDKVPFVELSLHFRQGSYENWTVESPLLPDGVDAFGVTPDDAIKMALSHL